jgi:hypothetical protein
MLVLWGEVNLTRMEIDDDSKKLGRDHIVLHIIDIVHTSQVYVALFTKYAYRFNKLIWYTIYTCVSLNKNVLLRMIKFKFE